MIQPVLGVIFCMLILGFNDILNLVNIEKVALPRFRVSAHRLEVETGIWYKPVVDPSMEENVEPV